MKRFLIIINLYLFSVISCKTDVAKQPDPVVAKPVLITPVSTTEKGEEPETQKIVKETPRAAATSRPVEKQAEKAKRFPAALAKIFEAHGGLDVWNSMASLTYTHTEKKLNIVTTTELSSRKTISDMPNHAFGFDGKDVWLKNKNKAKYKKKPRFMYNLMFYFQAMPFVFADDGVIFREAKALTFEGKTYPGIGISFEDGVGESAKDDYVIYYNPETYRMEWLAYTMTFFSKKKSADLRFRRYENWKEVDGLLRSTKITRYETSKNRPTKIYSVSKFENLTFSKTPPDPALFKIPTGAKIIE